MEYKSNTLKNSLITGSVILMFSSFGFHYLNDSFKKESQNIKNYIIENKLNKSDSKFSDYQYMDKLTKSMAYNTILLGFAGFGLAGLLEKKINDKRNKKYDFDF